MWGKHSLTANRTRSAALTLGAMALSTIAFGQGPIGDTLLVKFDRAVQVGSHTLDSGEYAIRQITSASNPRVLEFTSNNGTKLEATVTAIPVLQNTPPAETKIVLDEEGASVPRLRRIWVQGKTYGYEFPRQAAAVQRQASNDITLQGRFEAPAATVAQNRPAETPRQEAPAPAPVPAEQPAPRAEAQPVEPARPETPQPAEVPAAAPAPSDSTPTIPATALGWLDTLCLGLATATAGLILYRRLG
jgi:hypothetical protein